MKERTYGMLDKSVPFFDVFMHRKKGTPIPSYESPKGYRFVMFQAGDEAAWVEIETSVLEFPAESDALAYFQREFMSYMRELERRCIFTEDELGKKIATATAWWNYSGARRDPWLHWVSVKPEYQGLGFGKSITAEAIRTLRNIEGDADFYLHTQTWSYRAIGIYEKCGFVITDQKGLGNSANDKYVEAVALFKSLKEKKIKDLRQTNRFAGGFCFV